MPLEAVNVASKLYHYTALHLAVHSGNEEIVEELLRNLPKDSEQFSVLINAKDMYGQTALHWAINTGNLKITKLLLNDMDSKDIVKYIEGGNNATALHLAAQSNNVKIVIELLEKLKSNPTQLQKFIYTTDIYGCTALHWAGNSEISELLINTVIEIDKSKILDFINTRNTDGCTALHHAVHKGDLETTNLLLAKMLKEMSIDDIIKIMDNSYDIGNNTKAVSHNNTLLHLAVCSNNYQLVEKLLTTLRDRPTQSLELIMKTGINGCTVLHLVENSKIAELLINKVIEIDKTKIFGFINTRNINRYTALHEATEKGYLEITNLLLGKMPNDDIIKVIDNSYDVNGITQEVEDNNTLLHLAVCSNNYQLVEKLLTILRDKPAQQGIELIMKTDTDGHTPLHLAVIKNLNELKLALPKGEAARNFIYLNSKPAEFLRSKAQESNKEIVRILLSFFNNDDQILQFINQPDSDGMTLLHFAVLQDTEVVELFLDKMKLNHSTTQATQYDVSVLDFAAQHATGKTMEVLLNALSTPLNQEQAFNILHKAVLTLNVEVINALFENQAFDTNVINDTDNNNENVLHWIISGNRNNTAVELFI